MTKTSVAIIGVGLIGGSLGMALKKHGGYNVTGIGRDLAKLKTAKKLKAVDDFTRNIDEGVRDKDIIVVCTPVGLIAPMVKRILPFVKKGAVITDVGSVKGSVLREVKKVFSLSSIPSSLFPAFVGGHPLAGLEKSGVRFADKNLYKNACTVIVPGKGLPGFAKAAVKKLWIDAGAKVVEMTAETHDRIVSVTSHLPHVLAFSLCGNTGEVNGRFPNVKDMLAGSFRDTTRIADSNPEDWAAICSANKKELERSIDKMINSLKYVKNNLGSKRKLEKCFSAAKLARQKLLHIK
jgi:prephenate dehydrogenase